MTTTAVPIEVSPHVDRKHVVLKLDDCCIGLTKGQCLHLAVLLLEESVSLEGHLTSEDRDLLVQLNKRLIALLSELN